VNPNPIESLAELPPAMAQVRAPTPLGLAFGARVANIAMTAQVQVAYACAMEARARAQRTTQWLQRSWPDTPVRQLMLSIYRAQEQSANALARDVLAGARRRCGLAFARV